MVIDYSERRQSQRLQPKRPQRPSVWSYALIIVVMIAVAFMSGVGTGWYLFRPGGRLCKVPQAPQTQVAAPAPQPKEPQAPAAVPTTQAQGQQTPSPQPLNALPPADKGAPVPLTFYNTLQKGNKELMGTGINQPREGQAGVPKPAAPVQPEH